MNVKTTDNHKLCVEGTRHEWRASFLVQSRAHDRDNYCGAKTFALHPFFFAASTSATRRLEQHKHATKLQTLSECLFIFG